MHQLSTTSQLNDHMSHSVLTVVAAVLLPGVLFAPQAGGQEQTSSEDSGNIQLVQFDAQQPINPSQRRLAPLNGRSAEKKLLAPAELFGSVNQRDLLPSNRRRKAQTPAANAVFGIESRTRVSNDVGDLIRKSVSSHGVTTQHRTPIVSETRVRGQKAGQVLASGSYWTPVRSDLDTMMNKIDSRLIQDVILIKGPYSTRYGPGFRFVDFELLQTPRYNGFESHGSSSFDWDSNGEQFYARQTLWGGAEDWGYRASYGHRGGTDYETGNGTEIPASYKSRDIFLAFGWDTSASESYEFNYLRLDQTDLEFPGLIYDLNYLVTDGYELKYENRNPGVGDHLDLEVWYNQTRFEGDTLKSGKQLQIPTISTILFSPSGTDGFAVTDAVGQSMGYRSELTFGRPGFLQNSIGADFTLVRQELNDVEPLLAATDNNFPIPPSYSANVGLFWEQVAPVNESLTFTAGARFDYVATDADSTVAGVPGSVEAYQDVETLFNEYYLWSAFLTSEVQVNNEWTLTGGIGHGQRPPTLTELYAMSSFIGSLQRGLTALEGDPSLAPERLTQIDLGVKADYGRIRGGAHAYFSWIDDLITYDLLAAAGGAGGFPQIAQYVNTDQAIIAGFETYAEADINSWLSTFGTISYIEGRDLSRDTESRFGAGFGRSGILGRDHEPLPGMTPLESRLGLRFHDPSPNNKWGIELSARIVDDQNRVATSLEEVATPGFTTCDVRVFRRFGSWLFTSGIENFTDKHYREHLDYRSGRGVFRPGINFYSGFEVTY